MDNSMFESIKQSLLATDKKTSGNFRDFLRTEAGNTYVVRFLPNIVDASKTFFHYYHYGWNSVNTGQYIEALSPKTWGDPDPIEIERVKLYRNKSDNRAIQLARMLNTKEKWLVNVYVVDDPVNPENNGTIKVFRYGQQIDKIVKEAIQGEDAEEFGPAIFDLSENGCNLRIKVESTKEGSRSFVNYSSSRFLRASAIPNMTPEKIKEVLNGLHDLESYFTRKSPSDLKEMVKIHLYGAEEESQDSDDEPITINDKSSNGDPIDNNTEKVDTTSSDAQSDDDKIKELLAGL